MDPPHLVDVDGGKHVLEHAGHQLDVDLLEAEVAEHQQRVLGELLLVHAVPFEGRDHVLDQRVLRGATGGAAAVRNCSTTQRGREQRMGTPTCITLNVNVGPPGSRNSFCGEKGNN